LKIPEWKWEEISMDFIVGLPKTQNGYDSIWVIVDRLSKVTHFIPVKTTYKGSKLVELYIARIVCLHGVPKKIVSDRGKLAPRYIGPFKIFEQRGEVVYQLELPPQLSDVHDVFHVSQLRKCLRVLEEQMPLKELTVGEDLTYQEYPVKIWILQTKSPGITATRCVKCNAAIILKKKPLGKKKTS
jgi:hypothetical protein